MAIQVNAQTRDGVWGYQISVLDGAGDITESHWFASMPAIPLPMTDEQRLRNTEGSGAAMARSLGTVVTGDTTVGYVPGHVQSAADAAKEE